MDQPELIHRNQKILDYEPHHDHDCQYGGGLLVWIHFPRTQAVPVVVADQEIPYAT